jgi:hypothetical protein
MAERALRESLGAMTGGGMRATSAFVVAEPFRRRDAPPAARMAARSNEGLSRFYTATMDTLPLARNQRWARDTHVAGSSVSRAPATAGAARRRAAG